MVGPSDYPAVYDILTELHGVPLPSKDRLDRNLPVPLEEWRPGQVLLVAPFPALRGLQRREPLNRGVWVLSALVDPVVEVQLSAIKDRTIRPGRVYFVPVFARDGEWVSKPEVFQTFGVQLLEHFKKWAVRRSGDYYGPETLRECDAGTWTPVG